VARRSDALIHLSEGAADHCEDDQSEVYLNVVYLNVVYLNAGDPS
jgi:hypothetical protein